MDEEQDRDEVIEGVGEPAKEKTLAEPPDAVDEDGDEGEPGTESEGENGDNE